MRRRSIALALAVGSLALVGCGGDSDEPEAGSAATGGSTGDTSLPGAVESSEGDEPRDAGGSRRDGNDRARRATRVRRLPEADRVRELPLVHQVVRELIAGMNARDPSICTRLFDQRLVERSERAQETRDCEAAIARHPRGLELAEIESVQFRETPLGTESIVQFLARQDGKRTTRFRYHLLRSRSGYRIDQPLAAKQPGT